MKKLLLGLLLIPALAFAAPYDIIVMQRNPTDTGLSPNRFVSEPAGGANGVMGYNGSTHLPIQWPIGAGLTTSGGVLDTVPGGAPAWTSVTGKPTTIAGYGITDAFNGSYAALTGVPLTFAPSPHTHAAADVVSGTFAVARIPALPISQTTGLQAAIDGKFTTPTGTTGQYIRGDGSLMVFPALFSGAYADLSGIPSTFAPSAHTQAFSTITATPTTLAGYGISDGVTAASLASTLGGYATTGALSAGLATKFTTPAGTTAQYVRGDGSLATLPTAKRIEVYTGTTNASGQITVTYSTAFPATPVIQPPAPALANQVWTTVSSSTTGFTLQLNQRNTVTLLSAEVLLGATVPVSGASATILVVAQ